MELVSGLPLLFQQYTALLKKNAILTWRNRRSAAVQLFSSFFILLIFIIDKAIRSRYSGTSSFEDVRDPPAMLSFPIPPCEDKFFIKKPCFDFVWSGNASPRIERIVGAIMRNNPGRSIPSEKVKSFATPDEVDAWMVRDPMRCPGALHFVERGPTVISYGIQTNSTGVAKRGNYEDPTFKFQVPFQLAAKREIARFLIGGTQSFRSTFIGIEGFLYLVSSKRSHCKYRDWRVSK